MIHFTCDCCKQLIDLEHEVRYVMRMEVFAMADTDDADCEDDRDYLEEIEDMLNRGEADADALDTDIYEQTRFDLCDSCRREFLQNPLGRATAVQIGFSQN